MVLQRAIEEIEKAFPGIREDRPIACPGRPGYVLQRRGTKVLLRKQYEWETISPPAGDGGVLVE